MLEDAARAFMATHGWLSHTPPAFREAVLNRAIVRHFDKDQSLFVKGDSPGGIWGLVSGAIAIEVAPNQGETVFGHFAGPGFWIGAGPTITGRDRSIGVITRRPSVLLLLPSASFREIAAADPEAWRWLSILPLMQSVLAIGVAEDMMIRNSRNRLAAILLRLGGCRGPFASGEVQEITASQDEIATIANLSRTAVGSMVRTFEKDGLLTNRYRSIQIDPARLRSLVD